MNNHIRIGLLPLLKICFLAQYWKLTKHKTLVNKSGRWQHSKIKWSIPNCEGQIMETSSGKTLVLSDGSTANGTLVRLEESGNKQHWVRSRETKDGWFMIIDSISKRVLTATSETSTTITGTLFTSYSSFNSCFQFIIF